MNDSSKIIDTPSHLDEVGRPFGVTRVYLIYISYILWYIWRPPNDPHDSVPQVGTTNLVHVTVRAFHDLHIRVQKEARQHLFTSLSHRVLGLLKHLLLFLNPQPMPF